MEQNGASFTLYRTCLNKACILTIPNCDLVILGVTLQEYYQTVLFRPLPDQIPIGASINRMQGLG